MSGRLFSFPDDALHRRTVALAGVPESAPALDADMANTAKHRAISVEVRDVNANTTAVTIALYAQDTYGDSATIRKIRELTYTDFTYPIHEVLSVVDYDGAAFAVSAMADDGGGAAAVTVVMKKLYNV